VLGSCTFNEPRTGVLTLAPHANSHLALVLMANMIDGLKDVVSLATPTIPPMTRSPVHLHYLFMRNLLQRYGSSPAI